MKQPCVLSLLSIFLLMPVPGSSQADPQTFPDFPDSPNPGGQGGGGDKVPYRPVITDYFLSIPRIYNVRMLNRRIQFGFHSHGPVMRYNIVWSRPGKEQTVSRWHDGAIPASSDAEQYTINESPAWDTVYTIKVQAESWWWHNRAHYQITGFAETTFRTPPNPAISDRVDRVEKKTFLESPDPRRLTTTLESKGAAAAVAGGSATTPQAVTAQDDIDANEVLGQTRAKQYMRAPESVEGSVATSPPLDTTATSDDMRSAMEKENGKTVAKYGKLERGQQRVHASLGELKGEQSGLATAKVMKTSLGNGLTVGERFGEAGPKALLRNTIETNRDTNAQVHVEQRLHVEQKPTSTTYRPAAAAVAVGGTSASAPVPPIAAPAVVFSPPLLEDNAQLWACTDAAAGEAADGACSGEESAQAYCRLRGAQSGPALLITNAQPVTPVRAVNGDVCPDADACRVVSQLQCDH